MPNVKLNEVLFFVARHAQTAGNIKKTYRGWSNAADAQLDDQGRQDALEAGRYLASIGAPVELIVADSLDRVVETAELAAQSFPGARIEKVRALHPLDVGNWTGKRKDEHPVEPFLRETAKRIPGGESLDTFNTRQQRIFKSIFDLVKDFSGGRMLVVVHGSNVAYLHNHVFDKGNGRIGYEGLVEPGGIIAATPSGLVPLTKVRGERTKEPEKTAAAMPLIPLEPWALGYVTEKQLGGRPAGCPTCHMFYVRQKRCGILGPDIIIDVLEKDGEVYTPICGELYDHGEPMNVPDTQVMYPAAVNGAEKADQIGLEWAKGAGTNCGGKNGGAVCVKHYTAKDKREGFCRPLRREVYAGDCCTAHDGRSLPWREAQQLLEER